MDISKELAAELLSGLKSVKSFAGTAKDFIVEQVPDVLKQIVHWQTVSSLTYTILSIVFLISSTILFVVLLKKFRTLEKNWKGDKYDPNPWALAVVANVLAYLSVALICFLNFLQYLSDFLKVYFAPKVFLIEYLTHIVKSTTK